MASKIAGAWGDPGQAVRLLAEGSCCERRFSTGSNRRHRAEYTDAVQTLQAQMGEASFAEAWAAGQGWAETAAMAQALRYLRQALDGQPS